MRRRGFWQHRLWQPDSGQAGVAPIARRHPGPATSHEAAGTPRIAPWPGGRRCDRRQADACSVVVVAFPLNTHDGIIGSFARMRGGRKGASFEPPAARSSARHTRPGTPRRAAACVSDRGCAALNCVRQVQPFAARQRANVAIQFDSQDSPPSAEKACSRRKDVGVMSEKMNRTRMARPLNVSWL